MDEGADSGDILWQKPFAITLEDDASSVYKRIEELASEAIREFLPLLEDGSASRIPQNHAKAAYRRKRNEKDGEIDWAGPSMMTYNLVRALTHPYVGAHTYHDSQKVMIWRTKLPGATLPDSATGLEPGVVFANVDQEYCVRIGDGHLDLVEYDLPSGISLREGIKLGGGE